MFYIRTEKNKYDIDVIIDVSDNIEFINATNLPWIVVNCEKKPENGNYYYDGKIIPINSDDYSIIENIIFEYEEPFREERDKNLPVYDEDASIENISDMIGEEIVEEQLQQNAEITLDQKKEILELPKPKLLNPEEYESTQENFEFFTSNLNKIEKTIFAYDSGNYTFSDNEIVFNPPIEYPDGIVQEKIILPLSITLEEQIQHLKNQKEQIIILINRIKKDLEILD